MYFCVKPGKTHHHTSKIYFVLRNHVRFSSIIISTFSTIQSHGKLVDALPFSSACLAAAACLVLRSVNALSESALGILSKEEKSKSLPNKANSILLLGSDVMNSKESTHSNYTTAFWLWFQRVGWNSTRGDADYRTQCKSYGNRPLITVKPRSL